jgi:hypothetical protein
VLQYLGQRMVVLCVLSSHHGHPPDIIAELSCCGIYHPLAVHHHLLLLLLLQASAIGKNMTNAKTFLEKRFSDEMGLEDAVHTALLTLKEGFEGQVSGSNIEVGRPAGGLGGLVVGFCRCLLGFHGGQVSGSSVEMDRPAGSWVGLCRGFSLLCRCVSVISCCTQARCQQHQKL